MGCYRYAAVQCIRPEAPLAQYVTCAAATQVSKYTAKPIFSTIVRSIAALKAAAQQIFHLLIDLGMGALRVHMNEWLR